MGREVCDSIVGITGLIDTHTQGYEDNNGWWEAEETMSLLTWG